jgi:DNA excision repair protein ERCC-6
VEWTAVCLDEGHKIRNPVTDISIVAKLLPSFHRIILSGTPIQNNLKELWSLFDFIYPGRLGTLLAFELEFINPIRIGGYSSATRLEAEVAVRCSATLQRIVRPYLLRRKKDDLKDITKLPPKTEQILFCQISPVQRQVYLTI